MGPTIEGSMRHASEDATLNIPDHIREDIRMIYQDIQTLKAFLGNTDGDALSGKLRDILEETGDAHKSLRAFLDLVASGIMTAEQGKIVNASVKNMLQHLNGHQVMDFVDKLYSWVGYLQFGNRTWNRILSQGLSKNAQEASAVEAAIEDGIPALSQLRQVFNLPFIRTNPKAALETLIGRIMHTIASRRTNDKAAYKSLLSFKRQLYLRINESSESAFPENHLVQLLSPEDLDLIYYSAAPFDANERFITRLKNGEAAYHRSNETSVGHIGKDDSGFQFLRISADKNAIDEFMNAIGAEAFGFERAFGSLDYISAASDITSIIDARFRQSVEETQPNQVDDLNTSTLVRRRLPNDEGVRDE